MKCNVCGCELPAGAAVCRICGNPIEQDVKPAVRKAAVRPVDEVDFSWNTYDFPKPRKPEEIQMSWPEFNVHHRLDSETADKQIEAAMASQRPVSIMRGDAQEGFVSVSENTKPSVPQQSAARSGYNRSVEEPFEGFVDHSVQPKTVPHTQPQPAQNIPPQPQNPWVYPQAPAYTVQQSPQPVQFVQPQVQQGFNSVWAMPVQQAMPSEPLWYTQPVPPVQMVPVQTVPVQQVPVQQVPVQMPMHYTAPVPVYHPQVAPTAPISPVSPAPVSPMPAPQEMAAEPVSSPFMTPVFASDDEAVDDDWLRAQISSGHENTEEHTMAFSPDKQRERLRIDETRRFSDLLSDEPSEDIPLPASFPADMKTHVTAVPVSQLFQDEVPAAEEIPAVPVAEKPVRIPMEPVYPTEPDYPADPVYPAEAKPEKPEVSAPAEEVAPPENYARPAVKRERFYTFNKKNEEFQALLDAEYARARAMTIAEQEEKQAAAEQTVSTLAPGRTEETPVKTLEDEPHVTLEDLVSSDPSVGSDHTRVWTPESVEAVPLQEEPAPDLFEEKPAEEMTSFESMLAEGTTQRDADSDETITISLSKVRSAASPVRPLAEDVTIPAFADELPENETPEEDLTKTAAVEPVVVTEEPVAETETETKAEPAAPASASPFAGGDVLEISDALGSKAFSDDTMSIRLDEMRKEEALQKEQRSLRKQRLDEMAKARESLYGSGLTQPEEEKKEEPSSDKAEKKKTKKKEEKKETFTEYTKDDYNKKANPVVVLLIIIAVVAALFEGALLLLNRFAPDLLITYYMKDIETMVIEWAITFYETVTKGLNALFSK